MKHKFKKKKKEGSKKMLKQRKEKKCFKKISDEVLTKEFRCNK